MSKRLWLEPIKSAFEDLRVFSSITPIIIVVNYFIIREDLILVGGDKPGSRLRAGLGEPLVL